MEWETTRLCPVCDSTYERTVKKVFGCNPVQTYSCPGIRMQLFPDKYLVGATAIAASCNCLVAEFVNTSGSCIFMPGKNHTVLVGQNCYTRTQKLQTRHLCQCPELSHATAECQPVALPKLNRYHHEFEIVVLASAM